MLAAVEQALLPALRAAFPAATVIQVGPDPKPKATVELIANALTLVPPPGGEPAGARTAARAFASQQIAVDGTKASYSVSEPGEIREIESPPGRPLRRGDDYLLEGSTIKFYAPPQKPVVVTLFLDQTRGYVEKRGCSVELTLSCYGPTAAAADELLRRGLPGLLGGGVDLSTIEAPLPAPGARLRLLAPVLSVVGMSRATVSRASSEMACSSAELVCHGELETTITLGEPEPQGRIRDFQIGSRRVL